MMTRSAAVTTGPKPSRLNRVNKKEAPQMAASAMKSGTQRGGRASAVGEIK
jgi:hypothetical protein